MSDMTWVWIAFGCAAVLAALAAWCWRQWRRAQRAWARADARTDRLHDIRRDERDDFATRLASEAAKLTHKINYADSLNASLTRALDTRDEAYALLADIEPHLPKSGAGPKLRRRVRDLIGDENAEVGS